MKKLLLLLTAMTFSGSALAVVAPTIIGYNVQNAAPSGTGNWAHSYTGTIIDLGNGLQDYEGGTGTLADGIIGTSTDNTQLFRIADNSSITVFLDDYYEIASVTLFGGPEYNSIPGQITEVTFNAYGGSGTVTGDSFGNPNDVGILVNDLFSFPVSLLYIDGPINQFTISNITGDWNGMYSISEIQVSAVPEPATYALMLGGLGLVGFMAARRRRTA